MCTSKMHPVPPSFSWLLRIVSSMASAIALNMAWVQPGREEERQRAVPGVGNGDHLAVRCARHSCRRASGDNNAGWPRPSQTHDSPRKTPEVECGQSAFPPVPIAAGPAASPRQRMMPHRGLIEYRIAPNLASPPIESGERCHVCDSTADRFALDCSASGACLKVAQARFQK